MPAYIDKSILIKIILLRSGKTGKMSKKLTREIRSVWNTTPTIHLFKTGNSVAYAEPKDAATTELGKICHNNFG